MMRALCVVVAVAACSTSETPSRFDADVEGTLDGARIADSFSAGDDGATGVVPAASGLTVHVADGATTADVDLPRSIVYAGTLQVPMRVRFHGLELATDGTNSTALLSIESARWLGRADEQLAVRGSWSATFATSRGELRFVRGSFQLVSRCPPGGTDPRVCGATGSAIRGPVLYNDCPSELLDVSSSAYACIGGVCASDSYPIDSAGCRWHRFALAPATFATLNLAAWAEAGCLRATTCNVIR